MSKMKWVAGGLAAAIVALFLVIYYAPEGNKQTADSGGGGGAKAVKVDQKLADEGKQLSESNGCTSCHTVDGAKGAGPTWKGSFGVKAELDDGATVMVDDKFIKEAIQKPNATVRKGFGASMPENQLSDKDVKAVTEYIKSLSQ